MTEIIKIGGNVVDNEEVLNDFLAIFASRQTPRILVHGGGKIATRISAALAIETQMVEGRRITDSETLKVVTMVYAGLINKTIVAKLQALGIKAIGLCGADANVILSHKRTKGTIDYGFVGDVDLVDGAFLKTLIDQGYTPILSPITHDKKGNLLNTNADTIASVTAVAMAKLGGSKLTYCFELPGVLRDIKDSESLITNINPSHYQALKKESVIADGMIPKLDNCFDAISSGVSSVRICHALNLSKEIGTDLSS
jgi:acetylglutamate kinase